MKSVQGKAVMGKESLDGLEKPKTKTGLAAALAANTKAFEEKLEEWDEMQDATDKGLVPTWSFSGLSNYERCPHSVKLDKVDRVPQESGPAAARGSDIHDGIELWARDTNNELELPSDRKTKFPVLMDELNDIKTLFQNQKVGEYPQVLFEENWGARDDWSPCNDIKGTEEWEHPDLWSKAKLDVFILETETSAIVLDYKTGGWFGNEMKHADQGLCYALHVLYRYPDVELVTVKFMYIDHGKITTKVYDRKRLQILLPLYHNRAVKMTSDKKMMATPSAYRCVYCSYGCNTNKDGRMYGNAACDYDHYRGIPDE